MTVSERKKITINPNVVRNQVNQRNQVHQLNTERIKQRHLFYLAFLMLFLVGQTIVIKGKVIDLHYQIQILDYQTEQIEVERDAYYQHQAELSNLNNLKAVVVAQGATLDEARVFHLPNNQQKATTKSLTSLDDQNQ